VEFAFQKVGLQQINTTVISLFVLGALILILWFYRRSFLLSEYLPPADDVLYWQLVLLAVLMSGPMTWSMNMVWLTLCIALACRYVFSYMARPSSSRAETLSLYLLVLGLIIAAMPDDRSFRVWLPVVSPIFTAKYIAAEILIFAGLLGFAKSWEKKK
jgi:hypothetical protein